MENWSLNWNSLSNKSLLCLSSHYSLETHSTIHKTTLSYPPLPFLFSLPHLPSLPHFPSLYLPLLFPHRHQHHPQSSIDNGQVILSPPRLLVAQHVLILKEQRISHHNLINKIDSLLSRIFLNNLLHVHYIITTHVH